MQHIVFLDRATLAPHITLRSPAFAHRLTEYPATAPGQLVERLRDATIAITNKVPLRAEVLEQLPGLRLIAVAATGIDCVDKDACARLGIAVCNIPHYSRHTVPEHAFALMLALERNLPAYRDAVIDGAWQRADKFCFFDHPVRDLHGARLGIIGAGQLGQRVAAIARVFGMEPLFAARKGQRDHDAQHTAWDEVIATSDILTLHCPLTESSRNLIAWPEFLAMQRQPLLINTARGGLVHEGDLVRALDEGRIRGAAFDVASVEPPPPDHPLMQLVARPNVIITPHVAWASDAAQQEVAETLVGNMEHFVAGTPRHRVV